MTDFIEKVKIFWFLKELFKSIEKTIILENLLGISI